MYQNFVNFVFEIFIISIRIYDSIDNQNQPDQNIESIVAHDILDAEQNLRRYREFCFELVKYLFELGDHHHDQDSKRYRHRRQCNKRIAYGFFEFGSIVPDIFQYVCQLVVGAGNVTGLLTELGHCNRNMAKFITELLK